MAFNTTNPMFAPENLLKMSAAMFAAPTFAQGLGGATDALSTSITAQKQQQKEADLRNKTAEMLAMNAPDIAENVRIGAMSATDGLRLYYQQKKDAADAAKPKFMTVDGKIIKLDETTGENSVVGDYSTPKVLDPTSIQRDLQAAGLQPGTPEYQRAILEHYRKSGTMVDVSPDGTVRFIQGDIDAAKRPKLTESEGRNASFLLRAKQANELLTKVDDPKVLGGDPPSALDIEGTNERNRIANNVPVVGNYLRSDKGRQYQQAKDNFITAVLRKESGAVIGETEYDREDKKYFPQPNDDAVTIENKRKAREAAIEGLRLSSGPAASKIDGDQSADPMGLR